MPKSSRHRSHKQSKHSSKDYSDSEEDAVKMKERSNKDEGSTRAHRDSTSGEKRKISSQVREGRESKDLVGPVNGEMLEEYVSSKRRKEKADVVVGGDRWNGGGDEKEISDRTVDKEVLKRASLKGDDKFKENSSKGENTKLDSKNKSKRNVNRNEKGFASVLAEKEEGKGRSSTRKEGKESKDKDRRSNKERNGGQETKNEDAEVKMVDWDTGKKQGILLTNISEERLYKRSRDNTERIPQNELQSPELEKDHEKWIHMKREGSSEREKHLDISREGDERRASIKGDHLKDAKQRDEKSKDGDYSDKYLEGSFKDERRKDEKYRQETDKDIKYCDEKYQEDGEKVSRRRDYKYREDGDRESRRKEEKHREDGERDAKRKDEKYREGTDREGRRDDKHHEDGDRNNRRRDDSYYEDGDKDIRRGDDRYPEDGDRDDRRRSDSYIDDGDKENRSKDEKYREDPEKIRHKDNKLGDEVDREKRPREIKYEHASRDRSGYKSDPKCSIDDGYSVDYHSRKSIEYDESPTHDDRTARYRDDQNRRRTNEKEDYGDTKPRSIKDQRSDIDKKNSKMDSAADRVRNALRTADADHSSYNRKRSSPPSSSYGIRDHYRGMKQDESKYREYSYEERPRHNSTSTREYTGDLGGSENTASRSFEKPSQKDDGQLHELSAARHLKSDIRSSSLQMSGVSRDWKEYSSKQGRGSRESGMDVTPGDEHLQTDADTSSVSSPFAKNNHFYGSSKSLPPPPHFRTGMDSPLPMGSAEDDGRSKSHTRHRRISDPNMGRIQGSAWRGVPSWPSPMPNGFLPFPHGPPPVSFHSVMQPFATPLFGVRPSLELNHPSPYHMPDSERFSGPGRPMGWHNQVDDTCPPLHTWNGINTVFGDESRLYGRPDWDQSRNGPSGRGWETSDDMSSEQNINKTLEILSFDKENNSPLSFNEAGQSLQPTQKEQTRVDQLAKIADTSLSTRIFEKNDSGSQFNSLENVSDVARKARKEDVCICQVYLSKLDISADLAESELFTKCTNLINMDCITEPEVNDSKILYVEDVEAKMASHRLLSTTLFPSTDGSVFQRSMALYKRQKQTLQPENGSKPKVLFELDPKSDQDNQDGADDKPKELCAIDDMLEIEYTLPNIQFEADSKHSLQKADEHLKPVQQTVDQFVADRCASTEEPDYYTLAHVKINVKEGDVEKLPLPVENIEGSDAPSASQMKDAPVEHAGDDEELDLVDTKCGILLNSDVLSEAMMPESVVPESVNLSRIHHSPESTH